MLTNVKYRVCMSTLKLYFVFQRCWMLTPLLFGKIEVQNLSD